jgi:hypothetical protein
MPLTEVITRPGATPIWSRELNGIGVVLPPWAMVVALATVLVPPTFTITTPGQARTRGDTSALCGPLRDPACAF